MEIIGLWHLLAFAVLVAVVLYPTGRILARLGFSPFWSAAVLVPSANLAALWSIVLFPWPSDEVRSVLAHIPLANLAALWIVALLPWPNHESAIRRRRWAKSH
jgi:predicted PurR-regulated permease PerM